MISPSHPSLAGPVKNQSFWKALWESDATKGIESMRQASEQMAAFYQHPTAGTQPLVIPMPNRGVATERVVQSFAEGFQSSSVKGDLPVASFSEGDFSIPQRSLSGGQGKAKPSLMSWPVLLLGASIVAAVMYFKKKKVKGKE